MWREGDIVQDGGSLYVIDRVVYPPEGEPWVTVHPVDDEYRRVRTLPGYVPRRELGQVEFVMHRPSDRICMGRGQVWACFRPVGECECDLKCPRCPGERLGEGEWRCTCGEEWVA